MCAFAVETEQQRMAACEQLHQDAHTILAAAAESAASEMTFAVVAELYKARAWKIIDTSNSIQLLEQLVNVLALSLSALEGFTRHWKPPRSHPCRSTCDGSGGSAA